MRLSDDILHLLESLNWPLVGFEGEGGQGGNSGSGESSENEDEEENEEHEDEEDEDDESGSKKGGKKDEEDDDVAGLRSALKKERLARREAQKGLKTLRTEFEQFKNKQTQGQKEEEEAETKKQADAAAAKLERVSAGFARNAVDTAIVRALQGSNAPKFQDHDDVLRLIDRDDIDVDQDDDDPSKVSVDAGDIKRALKDLAKRKPHLLIKGEGGDQGKGSGDGGDNGQGGKTGRFGGANNNNSKSQSRRDELMKKYPALGRR